MCERSPSPRVPTTLAAVCDASTVSGILCPDEFALLPGRVAGRVFAWPPVFAWHPRAQQLVVRDDSRATAGPACAYTRGAPPHRCCAGTGSQGAGSQGARRARTQCQRCHIAATQAGEGRVQRCGTACTNLPPRPVELPSPPPPFASTPDHCQPPSCVHRVRRRRRAGVAAADV